MTILLKKKEIKTKLTIEQVQQIRKRAWNGERVDLIFADFKSFIKKSSFYDALNGITFKNIIDPLPFAKENLTFKICTTCGKKYSLEKMDKYTCKKCINKKKNAKKRVLSKKFCHKIKQEIILSDSIKEAISVLRKRERNHKRKNIISYAVVSKMRKSIRNILKHGKSKGGMRHLSYSKEELINHLLKNFVESIDLSLYHIDHIKPICSFDPEKLKDPSSIEFQECWSLSNLRLIKAEITPKR